MRRFGERGLALAATVVIPVALRVLPLPSVLALCDRWPSVRKPRYAPHALARRVRRLLAHGRGPWESTCLTRSLVLYTMLRMHGHRPRFVVGVAGSESKFAAHAWIVMGDAPFAEPGAVARDYAPLLSHGA